LQGKRRFLAAAGVGRRAVSKMVPPTLHCCWAAGVFFGKRCWKPLPQSQGMHAELDDNIVDGSPAPLWAPCVDRRIFCLRRMAGWLQLACLINKATSTEEWPRRFITVSRPRG